MPPVSVSIAGEGAAATSATNSAAASAAPASGSGSGLKNVVQGPQRAMWFQICPCAVSSLCLLMLLPLLGCCCILSSTKQLRPLKALLAVFSIKPPRD